MGRTQYFKREPAQNNIDRCAIVYSHNLSLSLNIINFGPTNIHGDLLF